MLNTLYIRTFLAVVDAGNYTAAAEQLHMSQPAISQHIRALEEQLGDVRLFRRVGQWMMPTHAGEELLAAARELMVLVERTEQNIRSLRGQVTGRVIIGCTANSGEYLLPRLLAAFRELFPSVSLVVHVAPAEMLLDALVQQEVTLLVVEEQQRRRSWESQLLGRETLALLAPPAHVLSQQEQVLPAALRDYPFILPAPGSFLRRTVEEGLRRRGVMVSDMQVVLESDSITVALEAVRDGIGLAFVPDTCLPLTFDASQVMLTGAPLHQEWYVLRLRERSITRAAQELYTFLASATARQIVCQCGLILPD